ncbi:TetR/AcrR family transcriptional regulator [Streptomyces shenzhenensis]|uniref:TetR/AcrR family transcriptional regulator n=1 Tax=Streptomyces shenzhenensis TaxID=943815 RepID=UPI0033EC41D9
MNERSATRNLIPDAGRANEASILNAALAAFAKDGFNGASMRDIARGAGTSLSNLYNYFASKEQLLAEVLKISNDAQLARTQAAVSAAGPGAGERLQAAIVGFIGFVVEHPTASLVAISEIRYLGGSHRTQVVTARDATQAIFVRIVEEGARRGEFRTPHPESAARAIVSMCSAISTWYHPEGPLTGQEVALQYARYARGLVEATGLS